MTEIIATTIICILLFVLVMFSWIGIAICEILDDIDEWRAKRKRMKKTTMSKYDIIVEDKGPIKIVQFDQKLFGECPDCKKSVTFKRGWERFTDRLFICPECNGVFEKTGENDDKTFCEPNKRDRAYSRT